MSAVRELTIALIKAGMDPVEATILIARAGIEMAPPTDTRTLGARRQAAYRERNKSSPNVTEVTLTETLQSVTKHNETSLSDAASLSKEERIERNRIERGRGSRLADEWTPKAVDWAIALELLGTDDRAQNELAKFRDHWKQQPGSKGVKLDWAAAWRNWIRRSAEYGGNRNGNGTSAGAHPASNQSGSTSIIAGVAAASERRARERNAAGQQRQAPPDDDPAEEPDPELFGAHRSAAPHH